MSTTKSLIDGWLLSVADRWERALSCTPPDWPKLEDIPASPAWSKLADWSSLVGVPASSEQVTFLGLVGELRGRVSRTVPTPTADEILSSLAANPRVFFDLLTLIQEGYSDIVVDAWTDYLDGMSDSGSLGDGPYCREIPGESNHVVAQVVRRGDSWSWWVRDTHDEGVDGDTPTLGEGQEARRSEALQACDRFLLEQGFYLVEPTCPVDEEIIETTYGGVAPPPAAGELR